MFNTSTKHDRCADSLSPPTFSSRIGLKSDIGYPHDGRFNKDFYPHDGRADKDSYPPDRHNQYIMSSLQLWLSFSIDKLALIYLIDQTSF